MNIPTDILMYITFGALLFSLVNFIMLVMALGRVRKLTRGKSGMSLENSIIDMEGDVKELIHFRGELEQYLEGVELRLKRSIQGVHTLRFNPFKGNGGGGNQSFATALLNEKGDGVILSSLYSRDHVSIFSKPVISFKSEFELTEEEQESVTKAKQLCK